MGSANAANGDMMSEFQAWEDDSFWPALQKQFGEEGEEQSEAVPFGQNLNIEVFNKRASHLRSDVSEAKVISAKTLTSSGVGEKRHIEIQLPSEMAYRAGDYLAILPLNPPETVHRVLKRFSLPWDAMLKISSLTGKSTLPTDHPVSAQNLFSAYLELAQPATKRNLAMLLTAAKGDLEMTAALNKLDANFTDAVTEKRVSLLDLLEQHPTLPLPLNAFIASLISMRVRQYSISSSPMSNVDRCTLTYAVLDAPSLAGERRHIGVASNYMSSLQPGDIVHVATRPSHAAFRLPANPECVPVVMIAAGAGLAPFRGFIQERAAQIGSGRKLAPARLYFGCRDPAKDDLYREELDFWEKMGAVVTHRSYSQKPEISKGHKHINTVLLAHKEELMELWDQGARVYVCGSRGLGESVKDACLAIAGEKAREVGKDDSDETLEKWFSRIRNERYSTDVFA
jgi:cytochrome P450/NADPH-cytochrome P450 reductase